MRKTWKILLLGGILLFSSHFLLPKQGNQMRGEQTLSFCAGRESCSIEVAGGKENHILHVLVADSKEERIQGLSYREQIPLDGMLFIFPSSKKYAFWMKGMSFPLDIIWINENGEVVGFKENALP